MREIKFRAWDKNSQSTYDVISISLDHPPYIVVPDDKTVGVIFDNYELMQYTGLKDENGTEVYLGDVIDIFWEEWPAGYYQENHLTGRVSFDETGTALVIKNAKYDWNNPVNIPSEWNSTRLSRSLPDKEVLEEVFLHHFDLAPENITILGNIYENPELLEVEN